VRTLHKDIVIIGVIFLAIGLVVGLWSVPKDIPMGSVMEYEQPYWLTGLVLAVGGAIIVALGFFDPGRKVS
jgi:amino acid transporter